jgi:hypothetical protein
MAGPVTLDRDIASLPTILTIQNPGSASGCVSFLDGETLTGLSACPGGFTGSGGNEVLDPEKTAPTLMSELFTAGITNPADLLFVLNSSEPGGGPLTIDELALTFLDETGMSGFTAMLLGTPLIVPGTGPANGGFAFRLDDFQAGLAASFFTNPNNRLGAAATVSGGTGGEQMFFFAPAQAQVPVPEPAPALLVCAGLAALKLFRRSG